MVEEAVVKPAEVIDLTSLSDSSESEDNQPPSGREEEDEVSEDGSEGSEIEIVLNEQTRTQLLSAIATVSDTRLRQVLSDLIKADITIEAALTKELVTVKRGTRSLVQRWETCSICDEDYDINSIREITECIFHPGELEMDEEMFVDWDERCHGPMDCAENRQAYPENFAWTCCDRDGKSLGCARGEHKPVSASRKRKRFV